MALGGLALALSRLIDNSVVVLENIFRHMEMGEPPDVAAERGGKEVQLAVLAATVSTSIVFFPVLMLFGVSKYLFTALALAVVISLFVSYVVAMTVVPLFCSLFITIDFDIEAHQVTPDQNPDATTNRKRLIRIFRVVVDKFNLALRRLETWCVRKVGEALERAGAGQQRVGSGEDQV
jgi:multidrug efflux pump subunit AcrB